MLKRVEMVDNDGATITCSVDENGLEQGPFEKRQAWGTITGYYKDGKYDGPAKLSANSGYVSEHVYRDGEELSGKEAEVYLREWKKAKEQSKPHPNFTLLTAEQVFGDYPLRVARFDDCRVVPTDLAILLGAVMDKDEYTAVQDSFACQTWLTSPYNGYTFCIGTKGNARPVEPWNKKVATRPVLPPSETKEINADIKKDSVGNDIVEYGEYPQKEAVWEKDKLEELYQSGQLSTTGKTYTFNATDSQKKGDLFQPEQHDEYEYEGKKYVRVLARVSGINLRGQDTEEGKPYWVKVQPIEWLVDPTGTWVSKKCLLGGIPFDSVAPEGGYQGDFESTLMKQYLDTYFYKDIKPSLEADREVIKGLSEKLAEISDLEKVKAMVKPARTPERTEQLARIIRVRKAKDLLSVAAQKAHKEGDKATLQEIVELAKPFAAREAAIRNKFNLKRAERRAKKGRG